MPEAVLLIDADGARCLAANAAARLALGFAGASQFPLALDSAMPAIAVLRAYARQNPRPAAETVRVTMWLAGRPVNALCELSPIAGAARGTVVVKLLEISGSFVDATEPQLHDDANDNPAQTSATTRAVPPPAGAPVPVAPSASAGPAEPDDDEPIAKPPVARDDAETLKEIARRIREGVPARRETSEPATAAAVQPVEASLPVGGGAGTHAPTPPDSTPVAVESLNRDARAKLAHELKTPLSAIVAASEIMRDERLGAMGNQQYLGYASDIHESATHALAVITRMLSRAAAEEEGERRLRRLDLNDLAMRTVSSMDALAAERELILDTDLEEGLPLILADETAVRQILINLLANAFKFTPPGGDIRVVSGYQSNGSAFLVVRDTGDGMDQSTIEDVFNDDAARVGARRGGGFGIGLKLVRRLARDIGADIEIDSAPLKGTVVLVSFPRHLLMPRRAD